MYQCMYNSNYCEPSQVGLQTAVENTHETGNTISFKCVSTKRHCYQLPGPSLPGKQHFRQSIIVCESNSQGIISAEGEKQF